MIDINELNKAISLTQSGKYDEAEALYKDFVAREPENPIVLSALGLFYVNIKDYEKASVYLERACAIKETPGTVSALGFAEFEKKNYKKCAEILEHAITLGENPEIYYRLIYSLFEINNIAKAADYAKKMYELYPENSRATTYMVKTLTHTGKIIEAEKLCTDYLKKHPHDSSLWFELGYIKELLYCDDDQACQCYQEALDLGALSAYYNIGVSFQKQHKYAEAEDAFKKMLKCYPNDNDAIISYGLCLLAQKKFEEGYEMMFPRVKKEYEKRFKNPWNIGDSLNKAVTVYCEQGLGDHIMHSRYLPILKSRVDKVVVATRKPLQQLFRNNFEGIEFIDYEDADYDSQMLRITDLAYILGVDFDHIPSSEGYLKAGTLQIDSDKPKAGFCWEAGCAGIRGMINRTIHPRLFAPFFNLENIQPYSFQVDDTLKGNELFKDKLINLAKDFKNFEDTAQALNAMDIVITVDTSVAHLAGALGKRTLLLLPYSTDWRWFDDTKSTPWYDSVQIFKQNDPISWEQPFKDIMEILQKL